jgi:hypothetical protein
MSATLKSAVAVALSVAVAVVVAIPASLARGRVPNAAARERAGARLTAARYRPLRFTYRDVLKDRAVSPTGSALS